MKLKLSELKPNPFKKQISKGELNREQINKIKANIKELGFFGSLPIFKKDNKYHLIAGHHRTQALKETYGKDFEVEVVVSNYNEDQVFRGMVVENITQRGQEFMELNENIVAIESYINSHKEILITLRESRSVKGSYQKDEFKEKATASDISFWIDKKTEEVISHDIITQNLNIFHRLDPELRKGIEKKHDKTKEERDGENLNQTQAVILSSIEGHEEQKKIAKVLKETREQRVREQGKLVTIYKEAPEEVKERIKKGLVDLADIQMDIARQNMENDKILNNNSKIEKNDSQRINEFLNYLQFSVSDTQGNIKQVIKYILILSKYLSKMDGKQITKLDKELKGLEIFLSQGSELISKIREKI